MSSLTYQSKSKYYYIKVYNKLANGRSKVKKFSTHIEITEADKKRIELAKSNKTNVILKGNNEVLKMKKDLEKGLHLMYIEQTSKIKFNSSVLFTEGLKQFIYERTLKGSKNFIKEKTVIAYRIAANHFIAACGDKYIDEYKERDFNLLLEHWGEKNISINSISIYTRTLRSLWNYFVKKKYTIHNIIEVTASEDDDPEPIPTKDMVSILIFFKANENPIYFQLVYFMLLTGVRPSSAMVQRIEDIDLRGRVIKIQNVKTGSKKKQETYPFPIYGELYRLLTEMGIMQGMTGRLFSYFKLNETNYTYPLSFWERAIALLLSRCSISKKYTLKQIRSTFANFVAEMFNLETFEVQKLLDHADIKTTGKHYRRLNLRKVRNDLDDLTFNDFLDIAAEKDFG